MNYEYPGDVDRMAVEGRKKASQCPNEVVEEFCCAAVGGPACPLRLTLMALTTSCSAFLGWSAPGFRHLGTMSPRGRHEAPGVQDYCTWLLKWRVWGEAFGRWGRRW